jgi:hypothetical protein
MRTRQRHESVAGRRSPAGNTTTPDFALRENRTPEFGIGAIRLELQKTIYTAGEAVEGTLLLSIGRPVPARGLFAILSAQQQFYRRTDPEGKDGLRMVHRTVYHYQQQLDGEKEYEKTAEPAAYPFRLTLPPVAGFMQETRDSASGSAAITGGVRSMDGSVPFGPPEWSVEGYLDLPHAFDVKTKVSIGVRQAP